MTEVDRRTSYTAGLRALADLLDQHPQIPLPLDGVGLPISIGFHGPAIEDHAGEMAAAARILIPGTRNKAADDGYFRVRGMLHGLQLEVWAMRDQVCERVVTGTREVPREVPDPAVQVPTVTVLETVEDVEWRCAPLLAGASSS
jgi:hypothetical protein